jgi:signal transduction histidine kinase
LVDNVIKFIGQGEVVLRREAGSLAEDAHPLPVSVRDSGIGIPAAQRSMIFQHFTKADSTTTRTHGGAGLGLAIWR